MENFEKQNISQNNSENEAFPDAPVGWKTNSFLSNQYQIDRETSKKIAEELRQDHSEYFKEYRDGAGNIREHYSPELIELIAAKIEKFKSITEAPDGWKTVGRLKREWHVATPTIEDISEKYKTTNPEYFKEFKDDAGKITNHYSPELVEIVKKEINSVSEAPQEWETNRSLARLLNVDPNTTMKIADKYKTSNPEYFKDFKIKAGQVYEHFSPELITLIKGEVGDALPAPKGWKTNKKLSQELNSSQQYISRLVNEYRESNPEYFELFKDRSGKTREHYSPELTAIVERKLSEQPLAPDGWMNASELATSLGAKFVMVQKIAENYCKINHEFCKDFTNQKRVLSRYYSPELVEIITAEIKKFKDVPSVPEGWENTGTLRARFNYNPYSTQKIIQRYHQTNPEYFNTFKDKMGRVFEYYSPELVAVIKKELEEKSARIDEVPQSWQSIQHIAEKAGVSKEEAEKIAKKMREKYLGQYGKFKERNDE